MKKLLILLILPIVFISNEAEAQIIDSAGYELSDSTEYCLVRVYGAGWNKSWRGVYIIYEDLQVEKNDIEGIEPEDLLKSTMKSIVLLKEKGFSVVTSTTITRANAEMFEYIFSRKKDR